jgi:Ubiquitin carboxyl-terminal hydrolase
LALFLSKIQALLAGEYGTVGNPAFDFVAGTILPRYANLIVRRDSVSLDALDLLRTVLHGLLEVVGFFCSRGEVVESLFDVLATVLTDKNRIYSYENKFFGSLPQQEHEWVSPEAVAAVLAPFNVQRFNPLEFLERHWVFQDRMAANQNRLFADVVSHFVQCGALRVVVERCQASPVSASVYLQYVRSIHQICDTILLTSLEKWIEDSITTFQCRVLEMTDEEISSVPKETFAKTVLVLWQLAEVPADESGLYLLASDNMRLEVAFRCFRSKSLDKRLYGLQLFCELIRNASIKDRIGKIEYNRSRDVNTALSCEHIHDYIRDHRILHMLYGDNLHAELVKRSLQVPQLLANLRVLTLDDLELMWQATVGEGKHESIVHAVYQTFEQLAPALDLPQVRWLFAQISAIPMKQWSKPLRQVLYQITYRGIFLQEEIKNRIELRHRQKAADRAARRRLRQLPGAAVSDEDSDQASSEELSSEEVEDEHQPHTETFALPLWFHMLLDSTDLPADVADAASENLGHFLHWEAGHPLRVPYMEKCVERIRAHDSVGEMVALLLRIVNTYPRTSAYPPRHGEVVEDQRFVIEWLAQHHDIVSVLIDDICHYKEACRAALASNPSYTALVTERVDGVVLSVEEREEHERTLDEMAIVGRSAHIRALRDRLDFLATVLGSTPSFFLKTPDVSRLWDSVIAGAFTQKERDIGFHWFEESNGSDDVYAVTLYPRVDDPALEHLFQHSFPLLLGVDGAEGDSNGVSNFDIARFSETGFSCFEFFFRCVNWAHDKFDQDARQANKYTVKDVNLMGMETLWKIALYSDKDAVGKSAIDFLMNLQRFLSPALAGEMTKQRAAFVQNCFRELSNVWSIYSRDEVSEDDRQRCESRLSRCTLVLESFFAEFEPNVVAEDEDNAGPLPKDGSPVSLNILLTRGGQKYKLPDEAGPDVRLTNKATIGHVADLVLLCSRARGEYDGNRKGLRLILGGQELKNYGATLESLNSRDVNIHVVFRPDHVKTSVPRDRPGADEATPPSALMSAEEYFEQLFALLNVEFLADRVWALLIKLPLNERLYKELLDLDHEDWSLLIDVRSPLTLLYSLQIIENLLGAQQELLADFQRGNLTAQEEEELNSRVETEVALVSWRDTFVTKGGLSYLLGVLQGKDTALWAVKVGEAVSKKRKQAQSHLVRVVNRFLVEQDGSLFKLSDPTLLAQAQVALPQLVIRLLELTDAVALPADAESSADGSSNEDVATVAACSQLALACCSNEPPLFTQLFGGPDGVEGPYSDALANWIRHVLLDSPEQAIREAAKHFLESLCSTEVPDLRKRALPVLLRSCLTQVQNVETSACEASCREFFTVLSWMVSADDFGHDVLAGWFARAASLIIEHPVVEIQASGAVDVFLVGVIDLARALLSRSSLLPEASAIATALADHLYFRGLFDIPTEDLHGVGAPPQCKTTTARAVAFSLLLDLCRLFPTSTTGGGDTIAASVVTRALGLLPESHRDTWSFDPEFVEKSSTGFVGLSNLGATCYMNSTMQQFFTVDEFRRELLAIPADDIRRIVKECHSDAAPEAVVAPSADASAAPLTDGGSAGASEDSTPVEPSLVYQVQLMFAHLQESEQKAYNTRGYCANYKPEGQPVNPAVQMDADEYFRTLFDRLENELKVIGRQDLLKRHFGGTMVNQIISRSCEHRSNRPEPCFNIAVDCMGKKTLEQALDAFIQGDMLEGDNQFQCSQCDQKVDALKRVCLGELSDHLIIHLKRFEFDLETLRRVKVNDLLQFPHKLNVKPYTQEGLAAKEGMASSSEDSPLPTRPDEYYQYRLRGILVHAGTAESGHYYSFIRTRSSATDEEGWFEFNDSDVDKFKEDRIEAAAFGGTETVTEWDNHLYRYVARVRPKRFSAYMLFYERVHKLDASVHSTDLSGEFVSKIWQNNAAFYKEMSLYSLSTFEFLWDLARLRPTLDDASSTQLMERQGALAVRLMFLVLAHSKDGRELLPKYAKDFGELMESEARANRTALAESALHVLAEEAHSWLRAVLFGCPQAETRQVLSTFISTTIRCCAPVQRQYYVEDHMETEDGGDAATRP